jgi:hypothetical protein
MAIDKKSLKKLFPNLYREIEELDDCKVPINAVRSNKEAAERAVEEDEEILEPTVLPDKLRHFNPSAVDFIRRCDTDAQAEEIINYLLNKGEISAEYACELKGKLKSHGVRCFGPKKEENYYFHEGGIY